MGAASAQPQSFVAGAYQDAQAQPSPQRFPAAVRVRFACVRRKGAMASGEPLETESKQEEEEDDARFPSPPLLLWDGAGRDVGGIVRFGSSTGLAKLRGRLSSMSMPTMPSMPSMGGLGELGGGSAYSSSVVKSFLVVGILVAFTAMCILAVIVRLLLSNRPLLLREQDGDPRWGVSTAASPTPTSASATTAWRRPPSSSTPSTKSAPFLASP